MGEREEPAMRSYSALMLILIVFSAVISEASRNVAFVVPDSINELYSFVQAVGLFPLCHHISTLTVSPTACDV